MMKKLGSESGEAGLQETKTLAVLEPCSCGALGDRSSNFVSNATRKQMLQAS